MPVDTPPSVGGTPPLTVPREAIQRFASILNEGRFWMYLIAWVLIIAGVMEALSIVGIIFAWIPIWTGIVLIQAAGRVTTSLATGEAADFAQALAKLRLYFTITGVLVLVGVVLVVLGFLFFGSFIAPMMAHGGMYGMHP